MASLRSQISTLDHDDRIVWGVCDEQHDSGLAILKNNELIFASLSERYSRKKSDPILSDSLIEKALEYGTPSQIYLVGKPLNILRRKLMSGQSLKAPNHLKRKFRKMFHKMNLPQPQINYVDHHFAHANGAWINRPWDGDAHILVIDAIGDFKTMSLWYGQQDQDLKELWSCKYPHSLGLFYSAFTAAAGYRPASDEYIYMGLASLGKPEYQQFIRDRYIASIAPFRLKENLHLGLNDQDLKVDTANWASSVQAVFDEVILANLADLTSRFKIKNLIYCGGCSLNCVTNSKIANLFSNIWIPFSPGDGGLSIGAALTGKLINRMKISPYLGYEIKGSYPIQEIIKELKERGIVGVANGRSEFGPRALGNRSFLADPRYFENRKHLQKIKQREEFRPYAPVVVEESLREWFDGPNVLPSYMQYIFRAKYPEKIPAVVHVDNSARVQTVSKDQHPALHSLLKQWEMESRIPILLNTSLNLRDEPIVENENHARQIEATSGIKVFS